MTYAQDREDQIVLEYFKSIGVEKGRFLDLGAGDFKLISNTRLLAEAGWGGLLVEASYRNLRELLDEAKAFRNVQVLNAAVAPAAGFSTFYDPPSEPFISTLSRELVDRGHERTGSRPVSMVTCTPYQIYREFGHFDFISIDIEGLTVPVLKALTYCQPKTRVVCAEFFEESVLGPEHTDEAVRRVLEPWGFKLHAKTKENVIYTR